MIQLPADARIAAVSRDESRLAIKASTSSLLLVDLEEMEVQVVTERLAQIPTLLNLTLVRFTPEGALYFSESVEPDLFVPRVYDRGEFQDFDPGERVHIWPFGLDQRYPVELVFDGDDDVVIWAPDSGRTRLIARDSSESDIVIFPTGVFQSPDGDGRTRHRGLVNFALDFSEGRPIRVVSPDGPIELPEVDSQSWRVSPDPHTWCGWSNNAAYRFDLITGELASLTGRVLGGARAGRDCLSYVDDAGTTFLTAIGQDNVVTTLALDTAVNEPEWQSSFDEFASETALSLLAVEDRQIFLKGLSEEQSLLEFFQAAKAGEGIAAIRSSVEDGGRELWYISPDGSSQVLRKDLPSFEVSPCTQLIAPPYISTLGSRTASEQILLCEPSQEGSEFANLVLLDPTTNTTRSLEGRTLRLQAPINQGNRLGSTVWESETKIFVLEGPNADGELDLLQFDVGP
ncbi:MAG: hypothetical protein AAGJ19_22315 [Myxococcota bacterium]